MMSLTMPFVSFHRKQIHLTWNGWSFTAYSTALVDFSTAFYIALKQLNIEWKWFLEQRDCMMPAFDPFAVKRARKTM